LIAKKFRKDAILIINDETFSVFESMAAVVEPMNGIPADDGEFMRPTFGKCYVVRRRIRTGRRIFYSSFMTVTDAQEECAPLASKIWPGRNLTGPTLQSGLGNGALALPPPP
jgi:hypothetical protein